MNFHKYPIPIFFNLFFFLSLLCERLWKQCLNFHIRWCFTTNTEKKKKKEILFSIYVLTKMFENWLIFFFFYIVLYHFVSYLSLDFHCFASKFFSKNITTQEANTDPCRCCIPVLLEHHTLILTCDNSGKTSYWNVILQYYLFRSYIRQFDGKVSATRTGCVEQSTRATSKIKSCCSHIYISRWFEIWNIKFNEN